MHYFKVISEFKLELQSGNTQFRSKLTIVLSRVTLKFDRWPWKTIGHLFYATSRFVKNNRAPLLCHIKLCASFHCHIWLQTGVTVRKWLNWVLTSVTLTFDLWSLPFPWISLLSMVITPENFMMIRWWEHSEKGVMDGHLQWNWLHYRKWSQLQHNPASDSSWSLLFVDIEIAFILLD